MKKILAFLLAMAMILTVTAVVAYAEDAQPIVVVDGIKDDSYPEKNVITHEWYTFWQNNTTSYTPVDPERVRNTIYFTWDDDFVYVYFIAESQDPLFKPEPGQKRGDLEAWDFLENISIYMDTAPSLPYAAECQNKENTEPCNHFYCNCNAGPAKYYRLQTRTSPAFNEWWNYYRSDEGMFLTFDAFRQRRGGEAGYEDLEAMYKQENGDASAATFIDYDTNTYGCEFSYPRYEGEEYFKLNITNGAAPKDWGGDIGPELEYTISANSAWWMNKDGMFEIWYEDYIVDVEEPTAVITAKRLINELPEKITLEHEAAVTSANNAFTKLSEEDVETWIDAALVQKLQEAIHCVEVWRVIVKLGDIDGAGEIDANDALIALRNAVGKQELDEAQFVRADVNADDKIDAADALDILKYAVDKLERFAAAEKMEAELYAE